MWVTRSTDPRLDSDRGPPYEGVRDAEVRVIAGGDTIWLVETPSFPCTVTRGISAEEGVGCYRSSLPASVLSGATYGLDIRLPDGTRATGQTVVPAPVTISAPAPDLRVTVTCPDGEYCYGENMDVPPYTRPVATVPLGWDLPPSVAGAHLALRPLAVYRDDVVYPGEACGLGYNPRYASGQSTYRPGDEEWSIPNIRCQNEYPELNPARFDSIQAELVVMGLNETYVEYLTAGGWGGIRAEASSHGIAGAYGVFGAMSRASRTVMLVRDPPPISIPEENS